MKTIIITFIFISSLIFSLQAANQPEVNKPIIPESRQVKAPLKQEENSWIRLDNRFVTQIMDDMNKLIMEGNDPDSKLLSEGQLTYFAGNLDRLYKHPDTEKVTRLSRDWYLKLYKIVFEMVSCRRDMNMAVLKIEKEKIKSLESQYKSLKGAYSKIYEKPEKIKK